MPFEELKSSQVKSSLCRELASSWQEQGVRRPHDEAGVVLCEGPALLASQALVLAQLDPRTAQHVLPYT